MDEAALKRKEDARGWQERLEAAPTVEDVLQIAREFVSLVPVAELGEVPAGAMPGDLDKPSQIGFYAVKLAHAHLNHQGGQAPGLHRISAFFTKAALRVLQIEQSAAARTEDPPSGDEAARQEHPVVISPSEESISRQAG